MSTPVTAVPHQLTDERIEDVEALEEEFLCLNGGFSPGYERRRRICIAELEQARALPMTSQAQDKINDAIAKWRSAFYEFLHEEAAPRTALCLSGGGIRSATFSLGVLQGLARHNLLKSVTFLSTVSGGGYIGSWLIAWILRHEQGIDGVNDRLYRGRETPDPSRPEAGAIERLREYSHYLAPKFGLLTADTWTLAGIYLRNLAVNWIVFLPILASVLALPRGYVTVLSRDAFWPYLIPAAGMLWGYSVARMTIDFPDEQTAPREGHGEWHFLFHSLLPLGLAGLLFAVAFRHPEMLRRGPEASGILIVRWAGWGALAQLIGWIVRIFVLDRVPNAGRRAAAIWAFAAILSGAATGAGFWIVCRSWSLHVANAGLVLTAIAGPTLAWTVCLVAGLFYLTFASWGMNDQQLEWYARAGAWVLILIAGWVAISSICLLGPIFALWIAGLPTSARRTGLGLIVAIAAVAVFAGRSSHARGTARQPRPAGWFEGTVDVVAAATLPLVLAVLLMLVSLAVHPVIGFVQYFRTHSDAIRGLLADRGTAALAMVRMDRHGYDQLVAHAGGLTVAYAVVLLFGTGVLVDLLIDLGAFSLHGMYRDRLVRAYLAASKSHRKANLFTGFDPNDDLRLWQFRPFLFRPGDADVLAQVTRAILEPHRPFLEARRSHRRDRDNIWSFLYSAPWDDTAAVVRSDANAALAGGITNTLAKILRDHVPLSALEIPGADGVSRRRSKSDPPVVPAPKQLTNNDREVIAEGWNRVLQHSWWTEPDWKPTAAPGVVNLNRGDDRWWDAEALTRKDPILLNRLYLRRQLASVGPVPLPPLELGPFPIVNTALNLVGGKKLAWQQRKAESFTLSPLHVGSTTLKSRRTQWWREREKWRDAGMRFYAGGSDGGLTLGTALTVSGAAANPNMGYHSSPVVTFMLTLINARLGLWVANPSGNRPDARDPNVMLYNLLCEAFGWTDENRDWINLSDGGHFENLGLYEMVRRRCKTIIVVDAGQDEGFSFGDLGNAVAKVRIDFGIRIEFGKETPIHRIAPAHGPDSSRAHFAVGRIRYADVDKSYGKESAAANDFDGAEELTGHPTKHHKDGWILYIKPAITGDEPIDIRSYVRRDERFPHQPTANQFFTETQFESYRALGRHSLDDAGLKQLLTGATTFRHIDTLHERLSAYWHARNRPDPNPTTNRPQAPILPSAEADGSD